VKVLPFFLKTKRPRWRIEDARFGTVMPRVAQTLVVVYVTKFDRTSLGRNARLVTVSSRHQFQFPRCYSRSSKPNESGRIGSCSGTRTPPSYKSVYVINRNKFPLSACFLRVSENVAGKPSRSEMTGDSRDSLHNGKCSSREASLVN